MTNADIDYIENELKHTTVGYLNPNWVTPVPGTHWANALTRLKSLRTGSPPPPPPPPQPVGDFTKVLISGRDINAFLSSLNPGDRAGIEPGRYILSTVGRTNGGTASEPITVASTDPNNPATVSGRLDMRGTFAWWVFDGLLFRDNEVGFATYEVSWVLGGNHVVFRRCDFSNAGTKIGMEQISSSQYGVGADNTLDRCRFHTIGRHPYGSTNNDHGLYDVGLRMHVVDTIFEDCSDRGLQIRGAHNAVYEQITISNCGEGVIFGDIGAVGCTLRKSILVNNRVKTRRLIEEYDPSGHDSGNRVDDCFAWNADGRDPGGGGHSVTITNLHKTDPQLDPVSLLPKAGSPAAGYGCRVELPSRAV